MNPLAIIVLGLITALAVLFFTWVAIMVARDFWESLDKEFFGANVLRLAKEQRTCILALWKLWRIKIIGEHDSMDDPPKEQ